MLTARMWGEWHAHTAMTGTWIRTSAHRHEHLTGQGEPTRAPWGGERRKHPNCGSEIGESGHPAEGAQRNQPARRSGEKRREATLHGKSRRWAERAEDERKEPRSGEGRGVGAAQRERWEVAERAEPSPPWEGRRSWEAERGEAGQAGAGGGGDSGGEQGYRALREEPWRRIPEPSWRPRAMADAALPLRVSLPLQLCRCPPAPQRVLPALDRSGLDAWVEAGADACQWGLTALGCGV